MGSNNESSNIESDRISNSIESLKYMMDRIYSATKYFVLFNDPIFEDRISNYFEYRILGDLVTLVVGTYIVQIMCGYPNDQSVEK